MDNYKEHCSMGDTKRGTQTHTKPWMAVRRVEEPMDTEDADAPITTVPAESTIVSVVETTVTCALKDT